VPDGAHREAAAAEPPQLVTVGEGLAGALEPLREDADHLAGAQQHVRVGQAGPGVAAFAGDRPEQRDLVDQVGAEQPQVPVGRVLVVQPGLEHDRVDGQRAGVVGDHQRGAGVGHVGQPPHLDPEPALVEDPGHRHEHAAVELRVEAELVDLGLAVELAARELQDVGDPAPPAARPGGDAVPGIDTAVLS
jgi:hypothetical protein